MNSKHDYSYYENECHIENTDNEYLSFKEKHVEVILMKCMKKDK
jgi:hypothetical protein